VDDHQTNGYSHDCLRNLESLVLKQVGPTSFVFPYFWLYFWLPNVGNGLPNVSGRPPNEWLQSQLLTESGKFSFETGGANFTRLFVLPYFWLYFWLPNVGNGLPNVSGRPPNEWLQLRLFTQHGKLSFEAGGQLHTHLFFFRILRLCIRVWTSDCVNGCVPLYARNSLGIISSLLFIECWIKTNDVFVRC